MQKQGDMPQEGSLLAKQLCSAWHYAALTCVAGVRVEMVVTQSRRSNTILEQQLYGRCYCATSRCLLG